VKTVAQKSDMMTNKILKFILSAYRTELLSDVPVAVVVADAVDVVKAVAVVVVVAAADAVAVVAVVVVGLN